MKQIIYVVFLLLKIINIPEYDNSGGEEENFPQLFFFSETGLENVKIKK